MQLLHETTFDASQPAGCGREVLDAVPPLIWFIRRNMKKFHKGLSIPQFRSLVFVQRQPCASLSALSEHLGSSMPTASRIAQGLVSQGLLRRQGCPDDRRQLSLAITERGQSVLAAAWSGTQEKLAGELEKLSPPERSVIVQAMGIIKTIFGSMGLGDVLRPVAASDSDTPQQAFPTQTAGVLQKA